MVWSSTWYMDASGLVGHWTASRLNKDDVTYIFPLSDHISLYIKVFISATKYALDHQTWYIDPSGVVDQHPVAIWML